MTDAEYMKEALKQAKKAAALGEVPIGCVIVREDRIIARGYNRRNTDKNVLSHAELNAMKRATKALGDWRLEDCTLYVTLEPCQMCAGAIVQARVRRVVVGTMNPKAGCAGSVINLLQMSAFNHQVELTTGVLRKECAQILTGFFKDLRVEETDDQPVTVPIPAKQKAPHGRRRSSGKKINYKVLFWDVDGTLLNFHQAEHNAVCAVYEKFGFGICTDAMAERYSAINDGYWKALERGEITKPELLVRRFKDFLEEMGQDPAAAEAFCNAYESALCETIIYLDDSYHLLEQLHGHVRQYAVTNGTVAVQHSKLKASGLDAFMDGVFISDEVGADKPSEEYFDAVLKEFEPEFAAGTLSKKEILIIGDSLSSDILGGNNAGIGTCWYNPERRPKNKPVRVDHEITDLHQVIPLTGRRR